MNRTQHFPAILLRPLKPCRLSKRGTCPRAPRSTLSCSLSSAALFLLPLPLSHPPPSPFSLCLCVRLPFPLTPHSRKPHMGLSQNCNHISLDCGNRTPMQTSTFPKIPGHGGKQESGFPRELEPVIMYSPRKAAAFAAELKHSQTQSAPPRFIHASLVSL